MLTRGLARLAVPVCLAACLAVLAACGGDSEPAAEPSPSVSTTPTPTPTPSETAAPEAEEPELPEFVAGPIGQDLFARYVVTAWAYALASNDAGPLQDVSAGSKPCGGCPALAQELAKRESEGWSVFPFEVTIDRVKLIQSALGTSARVTFSVPETKSFFANGSLRNTTPATAGAVFTVSMRLEGSKRQQAYGLVGFAIDQG